MTIDRMGFSWIGVASVLVFLVSLFVSGHALLRKRDPRSALWWVSINLLLPFVGPLLYYFFGINRIERKAARLRRKTTLLPHIYDPALNPGKNIPAHMSGLKNTVDRVINLPLLDGNAVTPLMNGDAAYAAMLEAIQEAQFSIGISTYIFEPDQAGFRFVNALSDAVKRGVKVRVLIDDVGAGFSWRPIYKSLKKGNVPVSYFLPKFISWRLPYFNLRNHRKILTVDGRVAFAGGMNVTESNLAATKAKSQCQDVHFKITGPVVSEAQDVFRNDWHFTTGEVLDGPVWFPDLSTIGKIMARAIPDGPDVENGKTRQVILGAIFHARKSIRIMTPYLIPDQGIITALNMAAMGGVSVEVLLPETGDMRVVQWASQAMLWQILEMGCRVWAVPPPFNHAKLMTVDGCWSLFGSSNWDVRSFRLNFEFNIECYDEGLTKTLDAHFDNLKSKAREVSLKDVDARSIPIKLRDGFARLFAPIL